MKIVQVNKLNYFHRGAEKYFLEVSSALEKSGHQVAVFSMTHPQNLPSPWSKYFVSYLSFRKNILLNIFRIPLRVLFSFSAKRKFAKLLDEFQPDLIHCHVFYHQISPSILPEAKKRGIPVIMHLHDYKLICPNYKLFVDGKVCERCNPRRYNQCLKHRCLDKSWLRSFLAMVEMYLHHSILKIYEKNVDLFIAPSRFMKDASVRFGWPAEKIKVLYNFTPSQTSLDFSHQKENYFLYFGALSSEKGVDTLIAAVSLVPNLNIKIVGEGPEEGALKEQVKKLRIDNQVEFLGFKFGAELIMLIGKAKAVVIPSLWPENMPFTLLETLAAGTPVIAALSGGLPELIKEGENGFLFKAGDYRELAEKLEEINISNRDFTLATKASVQNFNFEVHFEKLLQIYQEVLRK